MNSYRGDIIEESLGSKEILKKLNIVSTRIEKVTGEHKTPWLSQWTLHTIEISEDGAKAIANELSKSLDINHGGSWYVDFKNSTHHYIIFPNKVFYINRQSREQYEESKRYGVSIGIPEYQLWDYDNQFS